MIRVLLDTNVVLDALLDRKPWSTDARAIWQAHLNNQIAAHMMASAVTDIFYIARRHAGLDRAWVAVQACLDQLYLIPVGIGELQAAASFGGDDFEDDLQMACAARVGLDALVTRDPGGFARSAVEVIEPAECLSRLASPR